jgi:hypothetical protein
MLKFILIFLISLSCFAARPLTTDDAFTVEQGKYELEFGYDKCLANESKESIFGFSFKHGITEKMDVGLSFQYQIEPIVNEKFSCLSICGKFQIIKDMVSFVVSNELGSSSYFLNGIFSYEFAFFVSHFNIGYNASGSKEEEGKISYSFAFEKSIEKFDIVFEFLCDKIGIQNYLVGLRYNFFKNFLIDAAYSNKFKEKEEKITIGFHYEF